MTKQSKKLLKALYKEHQKYRKENRSRGAVYISTREFEAGFTDPTIDVSNSVEELSRNGYIILHSDGHLELTNKAVKHMRRRRVITAFEDIMVFIFDVFFIFKTFECTSSASDDKSAYSSL